MDSISISDSCTENDPDVQFYAEKQDSIIKAKESSSHAKIYENNILEEIKAASKAYAYSDSRSGFSCRRCDLL